VGAKRRKKEKGKRKKHGGGGQGGMILPFYFYPNRPVMYSSVCLTPAVAAISVCCECVGAKRSKKEKGKCTAEAARKE
jgi:hypothetical protein